jgi:hypothetical protein
MLQVEMLGEPQIVCSIFKYKGHYYCVLAADLVDTTKCKVIPVLNKSIQDKSPLHVLEKDQVQSAGLLGDASILQFLAPPPSASPAASATPEPKRPQRINAKSTPPPRAPDMSDQATEEDSTPSDVSSSDDAKVQVKDCKFCGQSIKMATSRSMQNHINSSRACKARRSLSHCLFLAV